MLNQYVTIDGFKYAVTSGTYIRSWQRSFTTELASNIIRINYVDRGPGVEVYTMTLELVTWEVGSLLYNAGITQTAEQQMANLEASYLKVATSIQFFDAFGNPPRNNFQTGVLFSNMNQIIPQFATSEKAYYKVEVTLTEGAGILI